MAPVSAPAARPAAIVVEPVCFRCVASAPAGFAARRRFCVRSFRGHVGGIAPRAAAACAVCGAPGVVCFLCGSLVASAAV